MKTNLDLLVNVFLRLKTEPELNEFLEGLLTPQEIDQLATRIEIIKRLKQDQPHHQIASDLGVGVATVTRGSKELQQGKFKHVT